MKVFKITQMFIDFDNLGPARTKELLEGAHLPNHISPGTVTALEERDIGEWRDDHPLNSYKTQIAAFQNLFATPEAPMVTSTPGDREFYELMQAYRTAPINNQKAVTEAYEAVKAYVKKRQAW